MKDPQWRIGNRNKVETGGAAPKSGAAGAPLWAADAVPSSNTRSTAMWVDGAPDEEVEDAEEEERECGTRDRMKVSEEGRPMSPTEALCEMGRDANKALY